MAVSTGIVLTATVISFGNEWYQTNTPNFRIVIGGLGTAIVLDAVENFSPQAGKGLAIIMLITVLATPFKGKSPAQTAAGLLGGTKR
jgi:hypothetical protein